jgi:hypothetical protein
MKLQGRAARFSGPEPIIHRARRNLRESLEVDSPSDPAYPGRSSCQILLDKGLEKHFCGVGARGPLFLVDWPEAHPNRIQWDRCN